MPFNSKEYRFADIKVSLFASTSWGLRGVKYSRKKNKELVHAEGDEPVCISSGNVDYAGSISMLKGNFDELQTAARAAGYSDVTDLPGFPMVVTYGNGGKLKVDTLINVEFDEYEEGMTQGDKFKEINLPILFTRIKSA